VNQWYFSVLSNNFYDSVCEQLVVRRWLPQFFPTISMIQYASNLFYVGGFLSLPNDFYRSVCERFIVRRWLSIYK
jgi:hypothetical protein